MKPFITPEMTLSGKKAFRYQCEGVECNDLWNRLKGQTLVAYATPDGQTVQEAWELSFVFGTGLIVEFSSACTQVVDWQEVGSLNVCMTDQSMEVDGAATATHKRVTVPAIGLISAERLVYEDDDVVVECGLVLRGRENQEVVIAAGISPGSVTVLAPFSLGGSFEPQFPLSDCRRERI